MGEGARDHILQGDIRIIYNSNIINYHNKGLENHNKRGHNPLLCSAKASTMIITIT